jgi:hypothetical protein
MSARSRCAIAAILLTPVLVLTGCSPASPAKPAALIRMDFCGDGPHVRPRLIDVLCASDAITARSLAWSGWGTQVATATGRAVVDLCAFQDCHTGSYGSAPIVLIASRIKDCSRGKRAYTRLQYLFVGRSPFQGTPANLHPSNFLFGTRRQGLPQNQTVDLTC